MLNNFSSSSKETSCVFKIASPYFNFNKGICSGDAIIIICLQLANKHVCIATSKTVFVLEIGWSTLN